MVITFEVKKRSRNSETYKRIKELLKNLIHLWNEILGELFEIWGMMATNSVVNASGILQKEKWNIKKTKEIFFKGNYLWNSVKPITKQQKKKTKTLECFITSPSLQAVYMSIRKKKKCVKY